MVVLWELISGCVCMCVCVLVHIRQLPESVDLRRGGDDDVRFYVQHEVLCHWLLFLMDYECGSGRKAHQIPSSHAGARWFCPLPS